MTSKQPPVLKSKVIESIIRCADDPIYFIENYCKVQHAKRGLVDFKLYDYQKEAIKAYLSHDKLIVNKARQLGFTTLTAAFIAWLILFHNDKTVLVVSINAEVAKGMIEKVKVILNHIPDWMYLADFETNRAHKIGLTNGSSVTAIARSDNAGRSKALSLLVIDEAAIIHNMDEMWKGLKSTVSTGGKILAMSTPKGMGNWFYKTWSEALSGENGWGHFLTNWWECPEYAYDLVDDPTVPGRKSSTWFREFTKDMTTAQIAQELLTNFIETGDTFFDSATISHRNEIALDPIEKIGMDRNLWVWKKPESGHQYLISADTGQGVGKDYSAFHVINLTSMEVVAEYMGHIYPDLFAELLIETAKMYNTAWIAPENAGPGNVTCYQIKNSDYNKLVFLNKEFKLVDKWVAEYQGILPGVPTDVRNRQAMVSKLEEALRKQELITYSKRLINEMMTFTVINGKPQAIKSDDAHDDLIMALAIGVWLREILPEFNGIKSVNTADMYKLIHINKETFNQRDNERQQRIDEMKQKLEKSGATILQPHIFNPYIYFRR